MATVGSLLVNLVAKTASFDRKINRSRKNTKRFGGDLSALKGILLKAGGVLGGHFAARGLVSFIKRSMDAIDTVGKLSKRIGMATEDIKRYEYAAEITGSSVESLHKSLEMFVRRMGEVKQGVGEATRGLAILGLRVDDLVGEDPAEAIKIIADRIAGLTSQTDKATASYYLFGRQGMQLVNMLQQGRVGIEKITTEADKLGISFSNIDYEKVAAANDALTRVHKVFEGIGQTLAIRLSPVIEGIADAFTDWATSGEGAGNKILNILESIALAFIEVISEVDKLIKKTSFWGHQHESMSKIVKQSLYKGAEDVLGKKFGDSYDPTDSKARIMSFFEGIKNRSQEAAEKAAKITSGAEDTAALAEHLKMLEDLETAAKQVYESTRTPLEQYEKKIGDLNYMLEKGMVDWESYGRAVRDAIQQRDTGIKGLGAMQEPKWNLGQVVTGGGIEAAASGFFMKDAQKSTDQQLLEVEKEAKKILQEISNDLKRNQTMVGNVTNSSL